MLMYQYSLFNAERKGQWRCMDASSLEDGAKVLEKRAIRPWVSKASAGSLGHICEPVARLLQIQ